MNQRLLRHIAGLAYQVPEYMHHLDRIWGFCYPHLLTQSALDEAVGIERNNCWTQLALSDDAWRIGGMCSMAA